MADKALDWAVVQLLTAPAVAAKVGPRVYKRHLALVEPEPTYPCVTISRQVPATAEAEGAASGAVVLVSAHSANDPSEAFDLSSFADAVLHRACHHDGPAWWAFARAAGPFETGGDAAQRTFSCHRTYRLTETN